MVTEGLEQAVREALVNGQLPCAQAFRIAQKLGVTPAEVGQIANTLDIRISGCQLGLFGYGPKAEGKHKIVKALPEVPPQLSEAIRNSLQEGHLPCAAAWEVAQRLGMTKLEVSGGAEALEIRIKCCQLGCF